MMWGNIDATQSCPVPKDSTAWHLGQRLLRGYADVCTLGGSCMGTRMCVHPGVPVCVHGCVYTQGLLHGYADACTPRGSCVGTWVCVHPGAPTWVHRCMYTQKVMSVGGAFIWPLPQVTSEQQKTHESQVTPSLPRTWAEARASLRGGDRAGDLWWPRLIWGRGTPRSGFRAGGGVWSGRKDGVNPRRESKDGGSPGQPPPKEGPAAWATAGK